MCLDSTGHAIDTVFDLVSLGFSIYEVATNPYDFTAWLGLAGDVVDVIPFVSGVGEVLRGVRLVDKYDNVFEIAEAVDFADDAVDTLRSLDRSSGFTKSTKEAGILIHKNYKAGSGFSSRYKEFSEISGIRPDYYDEANNVIHELKPFNPNAAIAGVSQLKKYNQKIGKNSIMRLEMY